MVESLGASLSLGYLVLRGFLGKRRTITAAAYIGVELASLKFKQFLGFLYITCFLYT